MAPKERGKEITLATAHTISDHTERRFAISGLIAGFRVFPGIKIVSPHHVKGRNDQFVKNTTVTDLTFVDDDEIAIVEVTSGGIRSRQKKAQKRVARRAHVSNYQQVPGRIVDLVEKIPAPSKKTFLRRLLKWR